MAIVDVGNTSKVFNDLKAEAPIKQKEGFRAVLMQQLEEVLSKESDLEDFPRIIDVPDDLEKFPHIENTLY